MNILDKIIVDKKREVPQEIYHSSITIEASVFFGKETISLSQSLGIVLQELLPTQTSFSSKSVINHNFTVEEVVKATKMRVLVAFLF
jgi:hypothetical protein